jgi:hypothetical protein
LEGSLNPQRRPAIIIGHKYTSSTSTSTPIAHSNHSSSFNSSHSLTLTLTHPSPSPTTSTTLRSTPRFVQNTLSSLLPATGNLRKFISSNAAVPRTHSSTAIKNSFTSSYPSGRTIAIATTVTYPSPHVAVPQFIIIVRPSAFPSRTKPQQSPHRSLDRLSEAAATHRGLFKQRLFGHTSILDELSVVPSASRKGSYLPIRHPQSSYSRPSRQGYHSCLHKRLLTLGQTRTPLENIRKQSPCTPRPPLPRGIRAYRQASAFFAAARE